MPYRIAANPDGSWSLLSGDEVLSTHPTWLAANKRLGELAVPEEMKRQPERPRRDPPPQPHN